MGILTKAYMQVFGRNLTPINPQLVAHFGGGPTNSGEAVSVHTALKLEAVYACTKLIAGTIATLPLQEYRRDDQGRGSIARNHSLYQILHDQPNADMTSVVFWTAMVACYCLWGNAYAQISRAGERIVALTPMAPDRTSPVATPEGTIVYRYIPPGASEAIEIPEADVMHIKGFSLDGLNGMSPVAQARETLGLAQAGEKAASSLFRNGLRAAAAFVMPTYLNDVQRQRFKAEWLPEYTGALNAGKTPFLEGGWKVEKIGMDPQDVQLLATRQYSLEQICRWFGVAPVMIGHMDKSTAWGTGLEQMNLWFLTYTLRPILRTIEQEIARSLYTPVERSQYYAEFNADALMRADSVGRATLLKVFAQEGLRTRNEIRALDNFPPLEGGDDLTVNSATVPLRLLGNLAAQPIPAGYAPPSANENQGAA